MTTNAGAPEGAPAGTPAPEPTPVPVPQADPAAVSLTSAQLKERLDETRKSERAALLKEWGFESKTAADAFLKSAKATADAQLTEQQRLAKEIEELKPTKARAVVLETRLKTYADREFSALPEAIQKAIDAVADGDAEKRLAQIEVFRAAGVLNAPTTPTTPPPAAAPANAGGKGPTPKPSDPITPYQKWKAMKDSGDQLGASLFYQLGGNARLIEASRPADT